MSARNRFGRNIESAKLELEATNEIALDDIKDDHVKTINPIDNKISAITK